MPKMSSIEFARKVAGYEGSYPQPGEDAYLFDLVKIIKSGGWILAYSPEKNAPSFKYETAGVVYTETLHSVGYTGIDGAYDITLLFTIQCSGKDGATRAVDLDAIHNQVQKHIQALFDTDRPITQSSSSGENKVSYTIEINTPQKLTQAIALLKSKHYLPADACDEITTIKETFKPEAVAFLKSMEGVCKKMSGLCS